LWFFFQGIESTVATAGFSVGEFAAMVFAEVMSFEDGEIIYILKRNLWKSTFFKT
jgi:malonyl CoA-acyl carrier protein transacylase